MTPRIKKAYRHFNAFLQRYQCKQIFWRAVQKRADRTGQTYLALKTKVMCCNRPQDWIIHAFNWHLILLDKGDLSWGDLHTLWSKYCYSHNYFIG